jgi:hypothetical protein
MLKFCYHDTQRVPDLYPPGITVKKFTKVKSESSFMLTRLTPLGQGVSVIGSRLHERLWEVFFNHGASVGAGSPEARHCPCLEVVLLLGLHVAMHYK